MRPRSWMANGLASLCAVCVATAKLQRVLDVAALACAESLFTQLKESLR